MSLFKSDFNPFVSEPMKSREDRLKVAKKNADRVGRELGRDKKELERKEQQLVCGESLSPFIIFSYRVNKCEKIMTSSLKGSKIFTSLAYLKYCQKKDVRSQKTLC